MPIFLRLADRPVILLGGGDAAEAKRRLLLRAGARIVGEDSAATLAVVAIEDAAEAEAAVGRLRARGMLVNAVDRPALCDFTWPAIIDRDPVLIAIGTGGASAGLAKALRQRIETLLPASLGRLAEALHASRPSLQSRFPDPADRRRAIDAALDPGGPLDPLAADSAGAVPGWIDMPSLPAPSRHVTIRLRSDDPDDLTLGEARLLGQADTLYHDGHIPGAILHRVRADARSIQAPLPETLPPGLTILLERPGESTKA